MSDFLLREQCKALADVLRLKELNVELLDTLQSIIFWLYRYTERHNVPFEEERTSLKVLLGRTRTLLKELTDVPTLPWNPSNDFLQGDKPNEDFTEPAHGFSLHEL